MDTNLDRYNGKELVRWDNGEFAECRVSKHYGNRKNYYKFAFTEDSAGGERNIKSYDSNTFGETLELLIDFVHTHEKQS